jgi:hypothetical protein
MGTVAKIVVYIGFPLLALAGWVQNVIALFQMDAVNGETVVRAIGVFVFPIGAIYGWF